MKLALIIARWKDDLHVTQDKKQSVFNFFG